MAATYLPSSAVATQFTTGADPWVITGPGGSPTTLDWIVVCLEGVTAFDVTTPHTGFVADVTAVEGTTDGRGRNYVGKFSDVGAGPYTFDMNASRVGVAIVAAVRGADQTTKLDLATTAKDVTASSATWTATSQTTVTAGCCILAFTGLSPNGATTGPFTTTGPGTEAVETGWADHAMCLGYLDQAAAGAVALTGTFGASEPMWTIQMAFRPASGPPPPVPNLLTVQSGLSWG